jgi:hypothetical protein
VVEGRKQELEAIEVKKWEAAEGKNEQHDAESGQRRVDREENSIGKRSQNDCEAITERQ